MRSPVRPRPDELTSRVAVVVEVPSAVIEVGDTSTVTGGAASLSACLPDAYGDTVSSVAVIVELPSVRDDVMVVVYVPSPWSLTGPTFCPASLDEYTLIPGRQLPARRHGGRGGGLRTAISRYRGRCECDRELARRCLYERGGADRVRVTRQVRGRNRWRYRSQSRR